MNTELRHRTRTRGPRDADGAGTPAKADLREIGPDRRVDVKGDAVEQCGQEEGADTGQIGEMAERAEWIGAPPLKGASGPVRHGFTKDEQSKHEIDAG